MATNTNALKAVRQRRYLGRDFDSLRTMLLEYARQYYPDRLKDFSEASLGGLLLDFAALTGDNLSFYLDFLYGELDPTTAVEDQNIQAALRSAGVPINGASPAVVPVTVYIQVPASIVNNVPVPNPASLPKVLADTVFSADNGTEFILLEDIDFNATNEDGSYKADVRVATKTTSGSPTTFVMAASGVCVSGKLITETISVGAAFVPFQKFTLANPDVSDIVQITDGYGNVYYQVNDLSHDVVYRNVTNTNGDFDIVPDALKVIPAPYRFTAQGDLSSRTTTLTFGGGSANTIEDDVIPDPSEFAISFPYSKTFDTIAINPQQLLQTSTLGVAATNTQLNVTYRYGGGLNNNAPQNTVRTVKTLKMTFPGNPTAALASQVRNSIEAANLLDASGGEDALTTDELKALIPSMKNSQERVATREDLLARVYTIPSNFGRVFRAQIRSNPNNPLASRLYIVSRNPQSQLVLSPDTLKQNLSKYLNPYRLISDAIDILDANVIDIGFNFDVLIDPALNRSTVLQAVLTKLQTTFNVKNFYIDQPINTGDVYNAVFTTPGVVGVNSMKFTNITGTYGQRQYSTSTWDLDANTVKGFILPPGGGIFHVRYPQYDVVGAAST